MQSWLLQTQLYVLCSVTFITVTLLIMDHASFALAAFDVQSQEKAADWVSKLSQK